MANGFGSLYIGASGVQNAQSALNTTANNLANVDTKGYVRQQVRFADKNYTTLKEISTRVEDSKLVIYLNKAYEIVYDLLMENIVPTDVKEDNILVNEETNDVVLIDLDGSETIYGPDNYLIDFPYNLDIINNNFDKMVNRLKIKKG